MDYVTRRILESLFGRDPLKFYSSAVGVCGHHGSRYSYNIKISGIKNKALGNTLWRLRQKELIKYEEKDDKVAIVLTEAGRNKMLSYRLDEMVLDKPKHWDGKWHIVIFDIPEAKKTARNALSEKMKELGLLPFQKSVWIYPFNCNDEIDFVAEVFDVGKYVHYIIADSITNSDLLEQRFGL